jgi:hypothetical protein
VTEIVIDPEVPPAVRRELEQAPLSALAGFCDPRPDGRPDDGDEAVPGLRLAATGIALIGIALGVVALCTSGPFSGDLGFLGVLLTLPVAVLGCLHWRQPGRRGRDTLDPAAYHRRYVVPRLDLHGDELARWHRASRAARSIRASEVVRLGLIDTVPVATVLPYHLWDVAERLALLSAPERRQAAILAALDPDDPDLRVVLEPQRRVREVAVADIERRIGFLEEFAALADRADIARKRQRAIDELVKLNPDYEELLTHLDAPDAALPLTDRMTDDLRALIVAADDAVRRANEAGRMLVIPPAVLENP